MQIFAIKETGRNMSKGPKSQHEVAPTGLSWDTLSIKKETGCSGLKQTKCVKIMSS